ncbi:hypothetical protein LOZ66_005958 [Ophidiomyces ophidiicola]|nr:hypothetical protein LOZ66_005958 [Ophidiomyces ophidiicola]
MSFSQLLSQCRPRKSLRFQVLSDLHLEVGAQYSGFHITPQAPYLILAGDIGRLADYDAFRDFLRSQCQQFRQVYLVLGNHEFFGVSRPEGLRLAAALQDEPELQGQLTIMNKKRVDLEDVSLLGCTLHSRVPPEAKEIVQHKINDFRRIVDWSVEDHVAEHARDVKWLQDEILSIRNGEAGSKRKIVVVTHHAPLAKGTSRPSDEKNPWSSAFGTELLGTKDKSPLDDVQYWVFGHTHYSSELTCGQVKLVSNQRGYVFPKKEVQKAEEPKTSVSEMLSIWNSSAKSARTFDADKVIGI